MIPRVAGLAVLLAFSLGCAGYVQAQTAADYTQGVTVSGSTATIYFNPTSSTTTWTDVHYSVNGGALQNLRMARNATTGAETQQVLQAVSTGNTIAYSFTYNKGSPAYDTPTYSYTVPAAGGGHGARKRTRHRATARGTSSAPVIRRSRATRTAAGRRGWRSAPPT